MRGNYFTHCVGLLIPMKVLFEELPCQQLRMCDETTEHAAKICYTAHSSPDQEVVFLLLLFCFFGSV